MSHTSGRIISGPDPVFSFDKEETTSSWSFQVSSSFTFEPIFVISRLPCLLLLLSFANVVLTSSLTVDVKKMFWQFERETRDWQCRLGLICSSSFTFQPRKKNSWQTFFFSFQENWKHFLLSSLHKHKSAQIVYLSIFLHLICAFETLTSKK